MRSVQQSPHERVLGYGRYIYPSNVAVFFSYRRHPVY